MPVPAACIAAPRETRGRAGIPADVVSDVEEEVESDVEEGEGGTELEDAMQEMEAPEGYEYVAADEEPEITFTMEVWPVLYI